MQKIFRLEKYTKNSDRQEKELPTYTSRTELIYQSKIV